MKFIDSLGDTFIFRTKNDYKVFYDNPKEKHKVWTFVKDLPNLENRSVFFDNIEITDKKYVYNLIRCKKKGHIEAWNLITNRDSRRAKKDYGYRFGAIETIFKNEKTNGFYIEKTGIKNIHSMRNMYSLVCIAQVYLTCLGTDVSKNPKSYKHVGFVTTKKNKNGAKRRSISLFKSGLRLFKLVVEGKRKIRMPYTFLLYDV